ncbi:hypothetical protein L6452_14541 [Arctium lappa]|uniref:Uncharacterized protein n=1 Tax=Arctium lappa TaxID=4217 RepID=A0ACB9CLB3_ARCLA|nr:hypothetical protein L6452_14541 [Arctium lappa]
MILLLSILCVKILGHGLFGDGFFFCCCRNQHRGHLPNSYQDSEECGCLIMLASTVADTINSRTDALNQVLGFLFLVITSRLVASLAHLALLHKTGKPSNCR